MNSARHGFVFRSAALGLAFCSLVSVTGCVSLVTKPFKLYDGPILPRDKIAVLVCVLDVQVNIDDKENVNPDSHKWGGRYEMLPGTHRIGLCPHASFLGPGYTNLPDVLQEDALYFDAAGGKEYFVYIEQNLVDKTLLSKTETEARYIVQNIEIKFYIKEKGSDKIVSRRTA